MESLLCTDPTGLLRGSLGFFRMISATEKGERSNEFGRGSPTGERTMKLSRHETVRSRERNSEISGEISGASKSKRCFKISFVKDSLSGDPARTPIFSLKIS